MSRRAQRLFLLVVLVGAGIGVAMYAVHRGWIRPIVRPIATDRSLRFLGKVQRSTAERRGGERAVENMPFPWTDWQNYYATADKTSRADGILANLPLFGKNARGTNGALIDVEYQRMELIKFNLFDNSGTYPEFVKASGPTIKRWPEMQLPKESPFYAAVAKRDGWQLCTGELIRHRNLTGVCNDIKNPAMGSTGMLFARNVQFESTFPNLGKNQLAINRHGNRLGLLEPDPQVISRELFTRNSPNDRNCKPDYTGDVWPNDTQSLDSNCDYIKAPFFNVLAAFWIQFMTHDWFSHLVEGHNDDAAPPMKTGCTPEEAARVGCRPGDAIDVAYMHDREDPKPFAGEHLPRAYRTTRNTNTAWWDASQIYGYDETSRKRVKRDPADRARLQMVRLDSRRAAGDPQGYLPILGEGDPMNPQWKGQEAVAFPDNWSIGTSFYSNLFAREHNLFVDEFRRQAKATPNADSGLRDPANPARVIATKDVSDDELFEIARLVVAAEIAKIHTIEWTPQLLYDEPLFRAMNANWSGLFGKNENLKSALGAVVTQGMGRSSDPRDATKWYSVFASGAGIFGLGNNVPEGFLWWKHDAWSIGNPEHVNGGVNHFGSPFNFPEEFVTVYRLHPLVPDLIEYRDAGDPNAIRAKIAVASTVRGNATPEMDNRGLSNWAVSLGRQRLGALTLGNHPRFLQNLPIPRMGAGNKIDVLALDLIRDRERGVPRFNEFRRQYGLRQLASYDDFIDHRLEKSTEPEKGAELARQRAYVAKLRAIYGQHRCDASKIITESQRNEDGSKINDCLGHANGTMVDNVEDVDTVVGWLAEGARPHGFAISETQFQVFILNASRRLFSDRFFTSSFRPEFYSTLGVAWVNNNGPGAKMFEPAPQNGHHVEVSPLKRILMRTMPELQTELKPVINAFDPWARNRGDYYTLAWKPRPGAEGDPAFK
jgi:hypothetical protein